LAALEKVGVAALGLSGLDQRRSKREDLFGALMILSWDRLACWRALAARQLDAAFIGTKGAS
jgi:hypothetical protein